MYACLYLQIYSMYALHAYRCVCTFGCVIIYAHKKNKQIKKKTWCFFSLRKDKEDSAEKYPLTFFPHAKQLILKCTLYLSAHMFNYSG